jgi:FkbM family methyltransferase
VNWLDDLGRLVPVPVGVVHVGAHQGQEVPTYQRLGFAPIVLVEPIPEYAAQLRRFDGVTVVEAAVASTPGPRKLTVTTYDQASSLLAPLRHTPRYGIEVATVRLDEIDMAGVGLLVVDTQGSELDVLRSGPLPPTVIVEVSDEVRYRGGCNRVMVEEFMVGAGFRVVGEYPHNRSLVDLAFKKESSP